MASLFSKLNPLATPTFPSYQGPYDVGTADVEIDASVFTSTGESPLPPSHSSVSTLQFRVFYPTSLKGEAGKVKPAPHPVRWFPSPRREYVAAYAKFMGMGAFWAELLSALPRNLYYIQLPVFAGHPLLKAGKTAGGLNLPERLPTVIFSHGLGGTRHTYSHLLGSIASQGCVVFALEHRDGSSATTFVRPSAHHHDLASKIKAEGIPQTPSSSASSTSGGDEGGKKTADAHEQLKNLKISGATKESRRIDYINHSHEISESTALLRNKQFEIRFWELGLMFAFAERLNGDGFAGSVKHMRLDRMSGDETKDFLNQFKGRLNVEAPGSITWMGHSFGGATITQFIKSTWYFDKMKTGFEHLYTPSEAMREHFHPADKSKERAPTTILLDPWTLPLLGTRTRALWRLPLPVPTLCGLSQEFYVWKPNLRGNRHVMSVSGGGRNGLYDHGDKKDAEDDAVAESLSRENSMDVTVEVPGGRGDAALVDEDTEEPLSRSTSYASASGGTGPDRKFFWIPNSAHLSHSDFGVLFPTATKKMSGAIEPEETLVLNARAALEFMRENGQDIAPYKGEGQGSDREIFGGSLERLKSVPLEMDDEEAAKEKEKNEKKEKQKEKKAEKEEKAEGKKAPARL